MELILYLKKIYQPDQFLRDEKDGSEEAGAGRDKDHAPFRDNAGHLWHTGNRWEKNDRQAQKMERCTAGNTLSKQ
jgi:hypothetical protein